MAGTASNPLQPGPLMRGKRALMVGIFLAAVTLLCAAALLSPPAAAAGQASTGELLFYPCTDCHPLSPTGEPVAPLPNDFKGHAISLEGHDQLGKGAEACVVCHDDPTANPGMLSLADGTLLDITTGVPRLCYQCHSGKYKDWQDGTHGRGLPSCTAAGCHDPHTPAYIYAEPLLPFVGTGFQFKAIGEREPFTPLAPPAPAPATQTPEWYVALVVVALAAAGGQVVRLLKGRHKG